MIVDLKENWFGISLQTLRNAQTPPQNLGNQELRVKGPVLMGHDLENVFHVPAFGQHTHWNDPFHRIIPIIDRLQELQVCLSDLFRGTHDLSDGISISRCPPWNAGCHPDCLFPGIVLRDFFLLRNEIDQLLPDFNAAADPFRHHDGDGFEIFPVFLLVSPVKFIAVLETLVDLKPFLEFVIDLLDDASFDSVPDGKTVQNVIKIFVADVGCPGKIDNVSEPKILSPQEIEPLLDDVVGGAEDVMGLVIDQEDPRPLVFETVLYRGAGTLVGGVDVFNADVALQNRIVRTLDRRILMNGTGLRDDHFQDVIAGQFFEFAFQPLLDRQWRTEDQHLVHQANLRQGIDHEAFARTRRQIQTARFLVLKREFGQIICGIGEFLF